MTAQRIPGLGKETSSAPVSAADPVGMTDAGSGFLRWTEGVATLPEEAAVSIERTGGTGAVDEDLAAVAAYIDSSRDVDTPE